MAKKCNDGMGDQRRKLRTKRKTPLFDVMPEEDLCWWFGCSRDTIQRYRNNEGLPYIKIGQDVYYSERQVYQWMLEKQVVVMANGNGSKTELHVIFRGEKKKPQKIKKNQLTANKGQKTATEGKTTANKGQKRETPK